MGKKGKKERHISCDKCSRRCINYCREWKYPENLLPAVRKEFQRDEHAAQDLRVVGQALEGGKKSAPVPGARLDGFLGIIHGHPSIGFPGEIVNAS